MTLNSDPEVIVVSGLPRSGTSLMMQMLARGGLQVVADGQRLADADNPAGYYEFEPVKKLKADAAWLAAARGKAVKVISQLLFDLPATERYAVILMQRDMEEVLTSQEKMLARLGRSATARDVMRSAFTAHLARLERWLADQRHIRVLRVNYRDLVASPAGLTLEINKHLGATLMADEMAAAVNPSLYRNRSGS